MELRFVDQRVGGVRASLRRRWIWRGKGCFDLFLVGREGGGYVMQFWGGFEWNEMIEDCGIEIDVEPRANADLDHTNNIIFTLKKRGRSCKPKKRPGKPLDPRSPLIS